MSKKAEDFIQIFGAREHNLKDIDVQIPREQLVVITGLSGSGKSSLAFDTIFAEGQRRYIDTFSAYARQFLGGMERPDVDEITGLSPVISIEQKTVNRSPRSTVGTVTEIYDFLRLLYARTAIAYSSATGEKMVKYSDQQITDLIIQHFDQEKIYILAPKVRGRKGHYKELFNQFQKSGFTKARVDGQLIDLDGEIKLDRYKIHDIELVIDRLKADSSQNKRVYDAVVLAMKHGDKTIMVCDHNNKNVKYYSRNLMCPTTGLSYPEPEPNLFSFNSPYGACKNCNGLGTVPEIDIDKLIPDNKKSIAKGGLAPLGKKNSSVIFKKIEQILENRNYSIDTPLKEIDEETIQVLLNGAEEFTKSKDGQSSSLNFEGIANFITRHYEDNPKGSIKRWAASFMQRKTCPTCNGGRLKNEAVHFKIDDKNITEVAQWDIDQLEKWLQKLPEKLNKDQKKIGIEILKEVTSRVAFINAVGLNYLSLNRSSKSLSGGEAQRIRLATQIGTELVNVLYILDEPSIGLHQRDNTKLIDALHQLKDNGNSVIVVEHDREMIEKADHVIDIGPRAGVHGGKIIAQGTPKDILKDDHVTAQYLKRQKDIEIPKKRRKGNGYELQLKGATGHNLKNINISIPLGTFTCVTGVSGSGKSSLINQTLFPALHQQYYRSVQQPLPYKKIEGTEHLDKVIDIDQSPIGRTPRSNPATYIGVFTDIRTLFSQLPEAQIRGYKPGRFSFNVKGGRCETCKGAGVKVIEMNFLPDVMVECDECYGKRYNRETLEVRYKGKSISDVLEMTIEKAVDFFENQPKIHRQIKTLESVGLGYVKLGQPSTTLSGGEAQRIKLSSELSKKSTGKTIYILDEPSTGLHFEDIRLLLDVLQRLVNEGNTVIVIEHNLDIIKVADHIIDIGLEGGNEGGQLIFQGTPEALIKNKKGYTAQYLETEIKDTNGGKKTK